MLLSNDKAILTGNLNKWLVDVNCSKPFWIQPSEEVLLKENIEELTVPRHGCDIYYKEEFTNSKGIINGTKVFEGQTSLGVFDNNYILKNTNITENNWQIVGSLIAIGDIIIEQNRTNKSMSDKIDILSSWKTVLRCFFEHIGVRRSVALAWKLFKSAVLVETQLYEDYVYKVLAGWLPGFCELNINLETNRYELLLTRGPELHALVVEVLAENNWLPDAAFAKLRTNNTSELESCFTDNRLAIHGGTDSVPWPKLDFSKYLRHVSSWLTGHRRWLCIEPVEKISDEELQQYVVAIGLARGIRIEQTVLLISTTENEAMNFAKNAVLTGCGPLAIVVKNISNEDFSIYRQYLFPYASIILATGSSNIIIDPRYKTPICNCDNWPSFYIEYLRTSFTTKIQLDGQVVIICNDAIAESVLKCDKGILFNNSNKENKAVVVPNSKKLELDLIHSTQVEKLKNVQVVYIATVEWKSILPRILRFLCKSFVLRIFY